MSLLRTGCKSFFWFRLLTVVVGVYFHCRSLAQSLTLGTGHFESLGVSQERIRKILEHTMVAQYGRVTYNADNCYMYTLYFLDTAIFRLLAMLN